LREEITQKENEAPIEEAKIKDCKELESAIAEYRKNMAKVQIDINKITQEDNEYTSQLRKVKKELENVNKEVAELAKLNEQLNDELSSLNQENKNLKEGLKKERKENNCRKIQEKNNEMEGLVKKQIMEIKRLESELIRTKQQLAETLNVMHELEQNEVFECEMSFSKGTSGRDNPI